MTLSVVIITLNEIASIGATLDSVRFADQVVVLDSGSTDGTVKFCRDWGAQVEVSTDWPGFGPQKNRALAFATGEWVLSLDADEVVSAALAQRIRQIVAGQSAATTSAAVATGQTELSAAEQAMVAWHLPRASSYCGRVLRHGGWWPDHVLRLSRRAGARFTDDLVHERLLPPSGPVGTLAEPLAHATYTSLEEVLAKVDRYSSEGARQAFAAGKRCGFGKAVGHGLWAFLRTWLIRASILDGAHGFMLAVSNAEATYYRYAKLWLLGQQAARRIRP